MVPQLVWESTGPQIQAAGVYGHILTHKPFKDKSNIISLFLCHYRIHIWFPPSATIYEYQALSWEWKDSNNSAHWAPNKGQGVLSFFFVFYL